jgi:hypothetical protein
MRFPLRTGLGLVCALLIGAIGSHARADVVVNVGYADNLRAFPFFPNPWQGDPGVIFEGNVDGGWDTGAIQIVNDSGAPITFTKCVVTFAGRGPTITYDLWHTHVIPDGESLILAQTIGQNFDSSDIPAVTDPAHPFGPGDPKFGTVDITWDGMVHHFEDTGHVLDTEGFDFAFNGANESHAWRPIGGAGGQAGIPEPSTITLFTLGVLGLFGYAWRRQRAA